MATPQIPVSTQGYANAISPAVRQSFIDTFETEQVKIELVATVDTLQDYNQLDANFTGLGLARLTGEAEAYKEDAPIEGFTTTYTPNKFTIRVPVTEEMVTFDKVGIADKGSIGRQIGISIKETIEQQLAYPWINGFSTSNTSYSDGKPLFSVSHTRVDGGSAFSNASSTGLPLTHDNLATAIVAMRATLDDRGKSASMRPKTLLVPPSLEAAALEIVKSSGRSDTAERADNVFGMKQYTGGMLNVVVWEHLGSQFGGSDTAWFLIADKSPIRWYWAKNFKPQIGLVDDSDINKNGVVAFVGKYMYALGWGNPRGVWGSKGDGAAYAS